MVIDPFGTVVLDMGNREGMEVVEIDISRVQNVRKSLPLLKNRRAELYITIILVHSHNAWLLLFSKPETPILSLNVSSRKSGADSKESKPLVKSSYTDNPSLNIGGRKGNHAECSSLFDLL